MRVGPADEEELAEHATTKTHAAVACAFASDCGNEVGVSSCVLGECEPKKHPAAMLEGVECDARLLVGIWRWCLAGCERNERACEDRCEFHIDDQKRMLRLETHCGLQLARHSYTTAFVGPKMLAMLAGSKGPYAVSNS